MGRRGKREYVQVLRLLETFSQQEVAAAVRDAIKMGAISFDAVKHLVLCRLEGRPPRLDLELYPYLPRVRVSIFMVFDRKFSRSLTPLEAQWSDYYHGVFFWSITSFLACAQQCPVWRLPFPVAAALDDDLIAGVG